MERKFEEIDDWIIGWKRKSHIQCSRFSHCLIVSISCSLVELNVIKAFTVFFFFFFHHKFKNESTHVFNKVGENLLTLQHLREILTSTSKPAKNHRGTGMARWQQHSSSALWRVRFPDSRHTWAGWSLLLLLVLFWEVYLRLLPAMWPLLLFFIFNNFCCASGNVFLKLILTCFILTTNYDAHWLSSNVLGKVQYTTRCNTGKGWSSKSGIYHFLEDFLLPYPQGKCNIVINV